jgi:hypothetical protein
VIPSVYEIFVVRRLRACTDQTIVRQNIFPTLRERFVTSRVHGHRAVVADLERPLTQICSKSEIEWRLELRGIHAPFFLQTTSQ